MINSGITITNSNINSGNPILIWANRQWQCGMNRKTMTEEETNNIDTDIWDIIEVDTEAVSNPTYTIYGLIDIDTNTTTVSINSVTTTSMTEQLLKQMNAQRGEKYYLHIRIGATPTFISRFDGSAVTEIDGGDATTGIKCEIKSIQLWGDITDKNISTGGQGSKLTYQINLVESV